MLSRAVTSGVIIGLSFCFIFFIGFLMGDIVAFLMGLFFLVIGLFILFNEKEDEIEEIKKK